MNDASNSRWWNKAVVYELYVDKFAGSFKGLSEKLGYFKYLGINTLWLLPHYPSPMVDGGYDISDYMGIKSSLGNMDDFEIFIENAHRLDLKVVTDLVLNHTSEMHPWFLESRSSKVNSKRDWYLWSDSGSKFTDAYVHFSNIKKNNWIFNESTGDFYYATFYPQQPDLNWDNPEVFAAMTEVGDFWLAKGVDGFRLDAVSRLIKRDNTNCFALPETHEVIKNLRNKLSEKYPEVLFMAESGGWINEAKNFFGSSDECQVVINFPLAANILSSLPDKNPDIFGEILSQMRNIPEDCRWGNFLTNHDTVDLFFVTDDYKKNRLAGYNHLLDRFGLPGSFSFAARLGEICAGNTEDALWLIKEQLKITGVPIIYYGNEIGMRNLSFDTTPVDKRDYVRGNFDWEECDKQIKDGQSLLNGVRTLLSEYNFKVE